MDGSVLFPQDGNIKDMHQLVALKLQVFLQLLAEKGELPTRFGSATLGILLFQVNYMRILLNRYLFFEKKFFNILL